MTIDQNRAVTERGISRRITSTPFVLRPEKCRFWKLLFVLKATEQPLISDNNSTFYQHYFAAYRRQASQDLWCHRFTNFVFFHSSSCYVICCDMNQQHQQRRDFSIAGACFGFASDEVALLFQRSVFYRAHIPFLVFRTVKLMYFQAAGRGEI
ncbi:hypothetical protein KCP73_23880 [Salmonella enterica subsp. enterica]|nr:hypothetical protein KCP73_23880 [Salmonella enterica subsp. enterica]